MALVQNIWDMLGREEDRGTGNRVRATVTTVEQDGQAWVSIEGGTNDIPVYSTNAVVSPGDVVDVTISGGKAYIDGSTSSPSVGMVVFNKVVKPIGETATDAARAAGNALTDSAIAKKVAGEAAQLVSAVGQHFWHRSTDPHSDGAGTGAFVTDETQDDFLSAAEDGFPDVSDSKPYGNLLMNSLGIAIRSALKNLVTITRSATSFYDGTGNAAANVTASFGSDGAQIGLSSNSHISLNYHSMLFLDKDNNKYFNIADLRDRDGVTAVSEKCIFPYETTFELKYPAVDIVNVEWTHGYNYVVDQYGHIIDYVEDDSPLPTDPIPSYTFSNNVLTFASVPDYNYKVTYTTTSELAKVYTIGIRDNNETNSGFMSSVIGYHNKATEDFSYSQGLDCHSAGYASHSQGYSNKAFGEYSHAEGSNNGAYGVSSHVEGSLTRAWADCSHAEGFRTSVEGNYSHAQNLGTIASGEAQTAIGKYNADYSANAFMIGDGTSNSDRHTGLAYRWSGELAMGAKDGGSFINLYQNHVTRGTTPSSDVWLGGLGWRDANGRRLGILEYGVLASGKNRVSIGISANNESGQTTNGYQSIFAMTKTQGSQSTRGMTYDCDTGGLSFGNLGSILDVNRIELTAPGTTAGHGGTIDFHYNQSTADYTYRIIEGNTALFLRGDKAVIKDGATGSVDKGFRVVDSAKTNNDAAESSNNDSVGYTVFDKDGHAMARMFHRRSSNGNNYAVFEACRTIDGTNYWNQIYVGLSASGQQVYYVPNAANFRSAIGAQATLSRTTTETSGVATAATNFKITAQQYTTYGKVAMVKLNFQTTASVSAGSPAVGTLASGKRPAIQCGAMTAYSTDNIESAWIGDNGVINVNIKSALASGKNVYVWSTFILP